MGDGRIEVNPVVPPDSGHENTSASLLDIEDDKERTRLLLQSLDADPSPASKPLHLISKSQSRFISRFSSNRWDIGIVFSDFGGYDTDDELEDESFEEECQSLNENSPLETPEEPEEQSKMGEPMEHEPSENQDISKTEEPVAKDFSKIEESMKESPEKQTEEHMSQKTSKTEEPIKKEASKIEESMEESSEKLTEEPIMEEPTSQETSKAEEPITKEASKIEESMDQESPTKQAKESKMEEPIVEEHTERVGTSKEEEPMLWESPENRETSKKEESMAQKPIEKQEISEKAEPPTKGGTPKKEESCMYEGDLNSEESTALYIVDYDVQSKEQLKETEIITKWHLWERKLHFPDLMKKYLFQKEACRKKHRNDEVFKRPATPPPRSPRGSSSGSDSDRDSPKSKSPSPSSSPGTKRNVGPSSPKAEYAVKPRGSLKVSSYHLASSRESFKRKSSIATGTSTATKRKAVSPGYAAESKSAKVSPVSDRYSPKSRSPMTSASTGTKRKHVPSSPESGYIVTPKSAKVSPSYSSSVVRESPKSKSSIADTSTGSQQKISSPGYSVKLRSSKGSSSSDSVSDSPQSKSSVAGISTRSKRKASSCSPLAGDAVKSGDKKKRTSEES